MKALTLTQPLAHLAAVGAKRLDARGWRTPYRGPVAIYAARWRAGMSWRELRALCLSEPYRSLLYRRPLPGLPARFPSEVGAVAAAPRLLDSCRELPRGMIVAVGELLDCRRLEDGEDVPGGVEAELGAYTPLCAVWELADVRPLALPVRVPRGVARSGLWRLPQRLRELVEIAATLPLPGAPEPMISRQGGGASLAPAHPETEKIEATNPEMKTKLKKAPVRQTAKVAKTPAAPIPQTPSAESSPLFPLPVPKPWAEGGTEGAAARFEPEILLLEIRVSPVNPRKHFAGPAMDELVASVRAQGVTTPILVRPVNDPSSGQRYEIVAGERRFRASALAGRVTIPALVQEMDDVEAGEKQAVENLNRADLSPLEEAGGYKHLLSLPGYTMARLIQTTGKAESTIYGKLKLLSLPGEAQDALAAGLLPAATAELIARQEGEVQSSLARAVLRPGKEVDLEKGEKILSVRQAREALARIEEQMKERAIWEEAKEQARKDGVSVLPEAQIKEFAGFQSPRHGCQYVALKQTCYDADPCESYGKLLGKHVAEVPRFLGRTQQGHAQIWIMRADFEAAVEKHGIKVRVARGAVRGGLVDKVQRERAARQRQEAAEAKAREDRAMEQVVSAVEMGAAANRLPAKFWTLLVSQLARQVWADTAREICRRRGIKKKDLTGRNHNGVLGDLAAGHGRENALGVLVEMVVGGARGYGGDRSRMKAMREALGLPAEASADVRSALGQIVVNGSGEQGAEAGLEVMARG